MQDTSARCRRPHPTQPAVLNVHSSCAPSLTAVVMFAMAVRVATGGVPTLDELGSTVQKVRVCNGDSERVGCHGRPANTWSTEKSCVDAGCCWFESGESDVMQPPLSVHLAAFTPLLLHPPIHFSARKSGVTSIPHVCALTGVMHTRTHFFGHSFSSLTRCCINLRD